MKPATPEAQSLAVLLLALEAAQSEHTEAEVQTVVNVLGKLRAHLSKLVGIAGFKALLTRALALATAEVTWLEDVHIQADATLDGLPEAGLQQSSEALANGSTALLAQILGLLVTFIGESLTLRLVVELWPEVQGEAVNFRAEGSRHE